MASWIAGISAFLLLMGFAWLMSRWERKRKSRELRELYEEFPDQISLAYELMSIQGMNQDWARTILKKEQTKVDKQKIDQETAGKTLKALLELRREHNKLRYDLEDWWEMSNGGTMDFEMEHLVYLYEAHNLEMRNSR